ncbi:kinase-like domain-containing protein [Sporodiniella umbellata]|nr:kinase-like domain-containing protein [Sporodiniella umbellata]
MDFRKNTSHSPLHIKTDRLAHHNPFPSPPSPKPVWRNQCSLTKPASQPKVTPKSWEGIQSPAAAFLSGFALSPTETAKEEEEEGDEIDDYVLDKVIGYGGFSVVRKGFRISDGKKVAVKVVQKEADDLRLEQELSIWRSLQHPNIVCLEKVLETDSASFLVCDYCEKGTLLDSLSLPLSEDSARRLLAQLCDALYYLHQTMHVCHKDLKLENILLDENDQLKLCDFGLAMYEQPTLHATGSSPSLADAGGSLPYAAPEQIQSPTAIGCPSTDIWALGVILYTLTVGRLPFSDNYDLRLQQKIMAAQFDLPPSLSLSLQHLIRGCLQIVPAQRLTIQQVRTHPWLA